MKEMKPKNYKEAILGKKKQKENVYIYCVYNTLLKSLIISILVVYVNK